MGTSATQTSPVQSRTREQRQSLRKRVIQPTPIELLPGKEVWLHDLSEGGLSVSGSSPLELGASTSPRFHLQEANSVIEATGVVAWNDNSGRLGVRFTRVEPAATIALRSWLRTGAMAVSGNPAMNDPAAAELATRISCLSEVADLQSVIAREQFDCDAALDLIVRRMIELTRATGAAIALREGDDVVCRARAGNAPDVGVRLSPTSLSGECFQSGTIVMLEDSESDPRVNPEICRQLNFRSLLVLPITSGTEIIGIAEVLSSVPRNFAGGDILVLSFLTDLIANVSVPPVEPDLSAMPEIPALQLIEDLTLRSELPAIEEPQNGNSVLAYSPLTDSAIETAQLAPSVVEIPEVASKAIPTKAIEVPVAVERATSAAAAPVAARAAIQERIAPLKPEKVTGIQAKPESPSPIMRWLPLAITVLVLLATAALLAGYYFSRSMENSRAVATQPANASTTSNAKLAPTAPAPATQIAPAPNFVKTPKESASARAETKQPSTKLASSKPTVTETATDDELTIVHGSSARLPANPDSAPTAPALGTLTSRGAGNLPASIVTASTPAPSLQPTASTGVTEGKLIKRVMPRYPEMARSAGISGDVVLSAKIAVDGTLKDIKVLTGSPLLRDAAIDAAKQWRYSPYKLGGKPVETETKITISFHR